jgi:hypothetical protein
MKTLANILGFIILASFATSCHKVRVDGPVRTEIRTEQGFDGIRSDVPADITYSVGSGYGIEISAQQALLDHMETSVNGGELKISFTGAYNFGRHDGIKIRIKAPALSSAFVNGSGSIVGPRLDLGSKPFTARVSGSGKIDFQELYCGDFNGNISGSGSIRIGGGKAQEAWHKISGSGNIDCRSVESRNTHGEISGSGTIRVWATDNLDARISGSGNIYYRGNPRVSSSISGSGALRND